ncbi:MAG: nucleotide sugar dehydrogenase [Candidatus Woesearchaeota archaeon]|jgi:UDPglucose 6-dehydrogenase|nr:nucleotide sugar dehydrogenase [Candidatus Woesearchaeota archaeon]MDP7467474.1 nucleotide sugar dehydrogenase [Candidatus Woesearchaeota archaeon]MDP7647701.1 nucleotide sugar dehydrogenase [Candidatus Woesearchaeota archaeon]
MKIGILGAWHLGAVVAAGLCEHHDVSVHDPTVESLKEGVPAVDEPGVEEKLKANLDKSLHITSAEEAIKDKDFVIIAHDSPVNEDDSVDISPILESAAQIKQYSKETIIVCMSQVPIGTCKKIEQDLGMPVAYVPENLRLGEAMDCFLNPDVVVIGADKDTAKRVNELYAPVKGERAFMSVESAEMWKHSMNCYLASMITLANNLADVAQAYGANITDVIGGLKKDRRVSEKAPLGPGLGFGGGTLGRDVSVLIDLAKEKNINAPMFSTILDYNHTRPNFVLEKLKQKGASKIAILGLAYKPGTNTLRRSIGVWLAKKLNAVAFDPAIPTAEGITTASSAEEACQDADAILIVTAWPEFKNIKWDALKVKEKYILDCRNMMDKQDQEKIRQAGFVYEGVGV